MRGQIVDINNLEAFLSLDEGNIITVPVYQIGSHSIGDFVYISDSNTNKITSYRATNYINPLIDFF